MAHPPNRATGTPPTPVSAEDDGSLAKGRALLFARQLDEAEAVLLRVPKGGPDYRTACVLLAGSAHLRGAVPFKVDHYLAEFVRASPGTDDEVQAFQALERLYRAQGLIDHANDLAAIVSGDCTVPEASAPLVDLPSLPSLHNEASLASSPSGVSPSGVSPSGVSPSAASPSAASPSAASPESEVFRAAADEGEDTSVFTLTPSSSLPSDRTPPRGGPGNEATSAQLHRGHGDSTDDAARAPTPAPTTRPRPVENAGFVPGALIADRYRLKKKIGKGGMATVFEALDVELDERVALKQFHSAHLGEGVLDRFKRELRIARRLRHRNIVQMFDLGVQEGEYFITMELLEGKDLHGTLKQAKGPLAQGRAARYLVDAARGLAIAHDMNVVHRDIKPGNLFVTLEDQVKVMDFGIAKATRDDEGVQTRTGMVLGTPQYMAPEQAQDSAHVDALSDIYALGVVAYELTTNSRPFDGGGVVAIMMAHVTTAPEPPRLRNPSIDPAFEALVLRCLEKKPQDRFPDARSLAAALAPFAGT